MEKKPRWGKNTTTKKFTKLQTKTSHEGANKNKTIKQTRLTLMETRQGEKNRLN